MVIGHAAEQIERLLAQPGRLTRATVTYNPHFDKTDNMVRCWAAGSEMTEDFRQVLERAMLSPEGGNLWYLSALEEMAASQVVWTQSIHGLAWAKSTTLWILLAHPRSLAPGPEQPERKNTRRYARRLLTMIRPWPIYPCFTNRLKRLPGQRLRLTSRV